MKQSSLRIFTEVVVEHRQVVQGCGKGADSVKVATGFHSQLRVLGSFRPRAILVEQKHQSMDEINDSSPLASAVCPVDRG